MGAGKLRFKFNNHDVKSFQLQHQQKQKVITPSIQKVPWNSRDSTTASSISVLEVKDVGFDISRYGMFFRELPKHIGHDTSLDNAIGAATSSFSDLKSGQQSNLYLQKFGDTLSATRNQLQDLSSVDSTRTLCAVYLLMMSQVRVSYS